GPGGRVGRAGAGPKGGGVDGALEELAERGRAPDFGGAVPAVAGEEGDAVDDHEARDALGCALREREPGAAPVVHDEAHALQAEVVEEALDEGVVLGDVVAAVGGLARAAEA